MRFEHRVGWFLLYISQTLLILTSIKREASAFDIVIIIGGLLVGTLFLLVIGEKEKK